MNLCHGLSLAVAYDSLDYTRIRFVRSVSRFGASAKFFLFRFSLLSNLAGHLSGNMRVSRPRKCKKPAAVMKTPAAIVKKGCNSKSVMKPATPRLVKEELIKGMKIEEPWEAPTLPPWEFLQDCLPVSKDFPELLVQSGSAPRTAKAKREEPLLWTLQDRPSFASQGQQVSFIP